jgi:hypothetical protein
LQKTKFSTPMLSVAEKLLPLLPQNLKKLAKHDKKIIFNGLCGGRFGSAIL